MKMLLAAVFAVSASHAATAKKAEPTIYNIDAQTTKVEWIGKKVAGPHNGLVAVKSGSMSTTKDGAISAGTIVVDMKSITNTDITDKEWNEKLIGHLKAPDFFDVEKYPEATLVIKNSKKTKNGLDVSGDLTIKGITQPVKFVATDVKVGADSYSAKASITVDRTKHGIVYNAGKGDASLMKSLGDKLIYDEFTLNINLAAKK
jgi:polyisoprenoid-binding protein YceI